MSSIWLFIYSSRLQFHLPHTIQLTLVLFSILWIIAAPPLESPFAGRNYFIVFAIFAHQKSEWEMCRRFTQDRPTDTSNSSFRRRSAVVWTKSIMKIYIWPQQPISFPSPSFRDWRNVRAVSVWHPLLVWRSVSRVVSQDLQRQRETEKVVKIDPE